MVEPFVHTQYGARVILAPGALARVPDEVALLTDGPVLLIASGSAREAADRVAREVEVAARIDGVRQHVPVDLAEEARAQATTARAIVCVGGGSATGLAKAVALTTGLPILAVPTTYAGSEMTPVWGMTEAGAKRTGTDPVVLPKTVVYDPELSRDLPIGVTAASVGNALAHCVEAVWTPRASPLTNLTAVEGTQALATGLRQVLTTPSDIVARSNLLYGACLAGVSMTQAGTGLHHKLCHLLGGTYGLPHAETHAVVLPHIAALNTPAIPETATRLTTAALSAPPQSRSGGPELGHAGAAAPGASPRPAGDGTDGAIPSAGRSDGSEAAAGRAGDVQGLALGLFGLFREARLPAGLKDLGLTEAQAREAADAMAAKGVDNPVKADRDTLREILARAWAGDVPEVVK